MKRTYKTWNDAEDSKLHSIMMSANSKSEGARIASQKLSDRTYASCIARYKTIQGRVNSSQIIDITPLQDNSSNLRVNIVTTLFNKLADADKLRVIDEIF